MSFEVTRRAAALEEALQQAETVYFALFEDGYDPDTEPTTEVSDANYSRLLAPPWTLSGDGTSKSNSVAITWPQLVGLVNVFTLALFDAAVGGNIVAWSPARNALGNSTPATVEPVDQLRIPIGGAVFRVQ